jgi:hypothetical protein
LEGEDDQILSTLDDKIKSANLNMGQGEIGLNLAQGKSNNLLIEFESLSKNME